MYTKLSYGKVMLNIISGKILFKQRIETVKKRVMKIRN